MNTTRKVIIIGGVAGGASAAARLRRLDENAQILLLERGEYISYANCGLPYYIGGVIREKSALLLQTPKSFHARFRIDVRTKQEAVRIDPEKKTVTVKRLEDGSTYEESYDSLVLSMGAEPIRPRACEIDSQRVFSLRTVPDTLRIKEFIDSRQPSSAIVVGGGFIGIEMAENLRELGLEVSLIEMADQVLPPLDYDMACLVRRRMEEKGVRLYLQNELKAIEETREGLIARTNGQALRADLLILAIGVRPETGLAKAAGLALNERGSILVNERMQTSKEQIYAVGDAVEVTDFVTKAKGFVPLAGPANKQGRIAADNICGLNSVFKGTQGSSVVKVFDLTVASTGINEKAAKRSGYCYDKSFTYSPNHAGYYPGARDMMIKTVYETETGRILGAQLVGYDGTDKRCDVLATAIRAHMTAYDLTELELCYAPPFGSAKDPVNMAGYVIENILTKKTKTFHWHEVNTLPRDGSVTLLDVRTSSEYENGHIDGFLNIPLDSLRDRLDELDREKPVYITCRIGQRGYIAGRILLQKGFDAYNLSGGILLYNQIAAAEPVAAPAAGKPVISLFI